MTAGRAPGSRATGAPTVDSVRANLLAVERRIADAGRDPASVRIVAVTKGHGDDAVAAATGAGIVDLGENYAAELAAKARVASGSVRWHFLGAVQRNKVPLLAPLVTLWQTVDTASVGAAIARRAPGAAVMVQVGLDGTLPGVDRGAREESRYSGIEDGFGRSEEAPAAAPARRGCRPGDTGRLVSELEALGLQVVGLMAVGPHGEPEAARPGFRWLRRTATDLGLAEVSMGMSADLEVAVAEGSTMVRIGRALFGPRP